MIVAALLLASQAAAPASAPPVPERFSVLARECSPASEDKPARHDGAAGNKDVVVCADGTTGARLPLPDERGPPYGPIPSNPKLDGVGALAAEGTPCAAVQRGCTVGVGPPPELIAAAVGAIKDVFARKPDKRGRVAIDLNPPAPPAGGHVLP